MRRLLHRAARLADRLADLGTGTPPEPQVWAELSPELALRRIARQALAPTISTEG